MKCMNREIEWNYAYFKKVRLCFTAPQKKLRDVKFVFKKNSDSSATKSKSGKKGR